MANKWIYWSEELGSQHNEIVGKKCANLGEMTRLGMRVPPGFAICVDGYEQFMEQSGAGEEVRRYVKENVRGFREVEKQIEASRAIRGIIESKSMPYDMKKELDAHYDELCSRVGMDRVRVAVRSSGAVSMPGQMESFLNVLGKDEVSNHVIKVWGSAFTTRAIAFRIEKGMEMERAPIGVAVLKMVNAKSAGVVLTVLPTTGDTTKVVVEGNWGLGESVVSGEVNPDHFLVDKETRDIESTINEKTKMVVYRSSGTATTDVPGDMQNQACLSKEELLEIVRVSLDVEKHFNTPQDMEWVVDFDLPFPQNIFWVQARPAKFTKKKEDDAEYIAELMTRVFKF
ncbi:MAG: PEP/pyruvate-binding domain-containing protein [Deltaproteobacteria bacterium]|jgi:pyruvate,water dikinase|nr:PEP/pyruvate-binding domain-containing protein [Deltaproteobacteria bacterium]